MDLPKTLSGWREAYAGGRFTPVEAMDALAEQAAAGDPAIWIHRLSREELRAHAERVTARGGSSQPLYGVPFAIKDNLDLAGAPTTAGCPAFAYRPQRSAAVVERLMTAGAIPVGKANLDQFATGLVGVRSPYGVPRNPFHAGLIPGGSSSGSAVAVAAGLAAFSLGTDTAGSGRIPAGLNELVGLKPTRGALSNRGGVPACRSLDCVSLFARSVPEAAELFALAAAYDPEDPYSRPRPAVASASGPRRVGVPATAQLDFDGDREARELFLGSLARLEACGWIREEIDFAPFQEAAALLYQGPWIAERWADLGEFCKGQPGALHPVTRQVLSGGAAPTAAEAFAGWHRLAALARRTETEWARMDALLVPTAPRPYTLAEVEAEPIAHNTKLGTYTNFVNLLDLCALAVPAGRRNDGVPWGVTFIARAWQDSLLQELGERWMAAEAPRRARLAVAGAHLSGLPLNSQLTSRGAVRVWSGRTSPEYRLYALPGTVPPKPGLVRVGGGGAAIAVEVWEMPEGQLGGFVAGIPSPLGIGTLRLEDGQSVQGFLCEAWAVAGAEDITSFGGWRAYLASRAKG